MGDALLTGGLDATLIASSAVNLVQILNHARAKAQLLVEIAELKADLARARELMPSLRLKEVR